MSGGDADDGDAPGMADGVERLELSSAPAQRALRKAFVAALWQLDILDSDARPLAQLVRSGALAKASGLLSRLGALLGAGDGMDSPLLSRFVELWETVRDQVSRVLIADVGDVMGWSPMSRGMPISGLRAGPCPDASGLAVASIAVPREARQFYFEARIISSGTGNVMCLGFVTPERLTYDGHLGWISGTYGYHGDDGQFYNSGNPAGPPFGAGDVIGVGWNRRKKTIFFTKNGKLLGNQYKGVPRDAELYPAASTTTGGVLMVNFGRVEFMYKQCNQFRQEAGATSTSMQAVRALEEKSDLLLKMVRSALPSDRVPVPIDEDGGHLEGGKEVEDSASIATATAVGLDLSDDKGTTTAGAPDVEEEDLLADAGRTPSLKLQGAKESAILDGVFTMLNSYHSCSTLKGELTRSGRSSNVVSDMFSTLADLVSSLHSPAALQELLWFIAATLHVGAKVDKADGDDGAGAAAGAAAAAAGPPPSPSKRVAAADDGQSIVGRHFMAMLSGGSRSDLARIRRKFYALLQALASLLHNPPAGPLREAVQVLIIQCWSLQFEEEDHAFLHESDVFKSLRQLMNGEAAGEEESKASDDDQPAQYRMVNILSGGQLTASSNPARLRMLKDSADNYWECSYDDKSKAKWVMWELPEAFDQEPQDLALYVDNKRDADCGVATFNVHAGSSSETMTSLHKRSLSGSFVGWVTVRLPLGTRCVQVNMTHRGRTARLRGMRVSARQLLDSSLVASTLSADAVGLFKLLSEQVFSAFMGGGDGGRGGGLGSSISSAARGLFGGRPRPPKLVRQKSGEHIADLREHLTSLLFDHEAEKLSRMQRDLFMLVSDELAGEYKHFLDGRLWEEAGTDADAFTFELVSMVLSLSGSSLGKQFVTSPAILKSLLQLFPVSTPRIQRQIAAILRRALREASYSALNQQTWNEHVQDVASYLLLLYGKALALAVRARVDGRPLKEDVTLADSVIPGAIQPSVAGELLSVLRDIRGSDKWTAALDRTVRESVASLPLLLEDYADRPLLCAADPRVWLALAGLCMIGEDHRRLADVEASSGEAMEATVVRAETHYCDNHGDSTLAHWRCDDCPKGERYLCNECDHYLHLKSSKKTHSRTNVKPVEREHPKLDYHEGCARMKMSWLMVLVDINGCKSVVEFRPNAAARIAAGRSGAAGGAGGGGGDGGGGDDDSNSCRFCSAMLTAENRAPYGRSAALRNVCSDEECQEKAAASCDKTHLCGHACGGVAGEADCLPCFKCGTARDGSKLTQDADDYCMACWTESLGAAPTILLGCGHAFHHDCITRLLKAGWTGARISFDFIRCPLCKTRIEHDTLADTLAPLLELEEEVRSKAVLRAKFEELEDAPEVTDPSSEFYGDLAAYAMDRFAYYRCFKCEHAYYGGERACGEAGREIDPSELICGGCSPFAASSHCDKHGTDYLEFKCRFCCSIAVFFCFGTTHFCYTCHTQPGRMTGMAKDKLPHCPAGPLGKQLSGDCPLCIDHPPTGEEFALGCGLCRSAKVSF
eukprot:PLAT3292.30.p1 GENE.PLAT3292.30~~PLAT3292.30.p1  ORF type:complete len:1705 (-),score=914.67 PLAT3292.30:92-4642(-)